MPQPGDPTPFRPRLLIGVVLAWSLLAFLPVIRNDFVNWDDFTAEGRLQEAEVHFRRAAEMDGSAWPLESLAPSAGRRR